MKVNSCPKCGSTDLGDRWTNGRKLQQYCHNHDDDCNWVGTPRTPERRRITEFKDLRIDDFYGWDYITYDKFGHVSTYSQTFGSKSQALKDLEDNLTRSNNSGIGAPYTGVVFFTPSSVKLKGEMFKIKKGIFTKVK